MAFKRQESLRRTRLAFSIFSITSALALTSIGVVNAADAPGTKGPIGTTGKTTTGVTGPVKGSTPTKLKSDIIVINAPVKKVVGQSGAQGSKGLTGAQGPQGEQGPEGEEGMVGPQGPEGLQGIQGIQGIQGPVGPQGERGIAGAKGEKGDTGPQGPPGIDGKTIIIEGKGGGAQGPTGPQGPKGDKGEKGDPGTSCVAPCTKGADGITPTITVDPTIKTGAAAVSVEETNNNYKFTFTLPDSGNGISADNVDPTECSGATPISVGLKFTTKIAPICAAIPSGLIGPVKSVIITDCASREKVVGLKLTEGALGVDCEEDLTSGSSTSLRISKTSSSNYDSDQECSSGEAIKGLKFSTGILSFYCSSVGSSGNNNSDDEYNHDDGDYGRFGDGNPNTKVSLAFAGLLGPTLASNFTCGVGQFANTLTQDASSNFGIDCSIVSFSASSSNTTISTSTSGSVSFSGGKFNLVIPSGIIGSTLKINSDKDSCGLTEKVSGLTLNNSKELEVTCATDDVTPITSATATPLPAGALPTASISSKKLTLGIPAGAQGQRGEQGLPGSKGDDGKDGTSGVTPVISVNSTISPGTPSVAVSTPSANNYRFTFTLPTVPVGYDEKYACFKSNGEVTISNAKYGSKECSGTQYKILLDSSP